MSARGQDTEKPARNRARAPVPGEDGWIKPKHGKGMLRPWQPGNKLGVGARGTRYTETVALARSHSIEAVQTLAERLRDPDGRIAVVAANSLLERAWGKVREAKPEENTQASIDLSGLTAEELAIMVKLVQSGRLRASDEPAAPAVIEGTAETS